MGPDGNNNIVQGALMCELVKGGSRIQICKKDNKSVCLALAETPQQDFHFTLEPYCISHDSVLNFGPSNRFN